MSAYYIRSFYVEGLWGYRQIDLSLSKDVNIIIGPNASGKTTILNLLMSIINLEILNLREIDFRKVEIKFKGYDNKSSRTIIVENNDNGFRFIISQKIFEIPLEPLRRYYDRQLENTQLQARWMRYWKTPELEAEINAIAKAVWLPVSRRLPLLRDDELIPSSNQSLESVDVRLRDLINELKGYKLGLDSKLSLRYKCFEREVLLEILFNREYDQMMGPVDLDAPTQKDKGQLLKAFEVAGLLNETISARIDEHFNVADDAMKEFHSFIKERAIKKKNIDFPLDILFILPLIRRTKSIVESARKVEEDRNAIYQPLEEFLKTINGFLCPKIVNIDETGFLTIFLGEREILPHMLSSGEKQILILLIQALIKEADPVIYVVDEPELSLHVSWQEHLLESLMKLSKNIQVIVATHSPDIVGPYTAKVIDLEKASKNVH